MVNVVLSIVGCVGFLLDCVLIGVLGWWCGEFDVFCYCLFQLLYFYVQCFGVVGVVLGNFGESVGYGDEGFYQLWVEFIVGVGLDQQYCFGMCQWWLVGVLVGQFIVVVGQGDDLCCQGNLFVCKVFWKVLVILVFVMIVGDLLGEVEEFGRLVELLFGVGQGVVFGVGMVLQQGGVGGVQLFGVEQDLVGYCDFVDVM